jgi:hypothetical protein
MPLALLVASSYSIYLCSGCTFQTAHGYVDDDHYTTLSVAGKDIAHNVTRVEFAAAAADDDIERDGLGSVGSTHRVLKTLTMRNRRRDGGVRIDKADGGVVDRTGFTAVSTQTATLAASSASVADASVPSTSGFCLDFMAPVSALAFMFCIVTRVHILLIVCYEFLNRPR